PTLWHCLVLVSFPFPPVDGRSRRPRGLPSTPIRLLNHGPRVPIFSVFAQAKPAPFETAISVCRLRICRLLLAAVLHHPPDAAEPWPGPTIWDVSTVVKAQRWPLRVGKLRYLPESPAWRYSHPFLAP